MIDDDFLLSLYKEYLISLATREGRPFNLPKSILTLKERSDFILFITLSYNMKNHNITTDKKIKKFMEIAEKHVTDNFHVSNINKDFEDIIKKYTSKKDKTENDELLEIKKSFDFLEETCLIEKMKYNDLFKGNPPPILKYWKEEKITDVVLLFMFDIEKMKKKTWFKIYCNDLIFKSKTILKNINTNVNLYSFLESEQLRLKNSTCETQN